MPRRGGSLKMVYCLLIIVPGFVCCWTPQVGGMQKACSMNFSFSMKLSGNVTHNSFSLINIASAGSTSINNHEQ